MTNTIEGTFNNAAGRYAIVAARFNEFIVERLVDGCENALRRHGIDTTNALDVIWVPGAYEIPLACKKAISKVAMLEPATMPWPGKPYGPRRSKSPKIVRRHP